MAREGLRAPRSRTPPVVEFAAHLGGFSRGSVRGQVMSCPQRVAHQTVPGCCLERRRSSRPFEGWLADIAPGSSRNRPPRIPQSKG